MSEWEIPISTLGLADALDPELAGRFIQVHYLHQHLVLRIAFLCFPRFGAFILGDADDNPQYTVAIITRVNQIFDQFIVAR